MEHWPHIAWPDWFGAPTGFDQPDPLIYWFLAPPAAYLWALYVAFQLSLFINAQPREP